MIKDLTAALTSLMMTQMMTLKKMTRFLHCHADATKTNQELQRKKDTFQELFRQKTN